MSSGEFLFLREFFRVFGLQDLFLEVNFEFLVGFEVLEVWFSCFGFSLYYIFQEKVFWKLGLEGGCGGRQVCVCVLGKGGVLRGLFFIIRMEGFYYLFILFKRQEGQRVWVVGYRVAWQFRSEVLGEIGEEFRKDRIRIM